MLTQRFAEIISISISIAYSNKTMWIINSFDKICGTFSENLIHSNCHKHETNIKHIFPLIAEIYFYINKIVTNKFSLNLHEKKSKLQKNLKFTIKSSYSSL